MIQSAEDVLLDSANKIMLDANIIIAYLDNKHKFHQKVYDRLSAKYVDGADFYCAVRAAPAQKGQKFKSTSCLKVTAPVPSVFFHVGRSQYIESSNLGGLTAYLRLSGENRNLERVISPL